MIAFVAVEFFSILWQPIYDQLQSFGFVRAYLWSRTEQNTEDLIRAALSKASEATDSGENKLERLGRELVCLCELYERLSGDGVRGRNWILGELKNHIKSKWPWLRIMHKTGVDPVDQILCWQLDHDLSLIHDWDLPKLGPQVATLEDKSDSNSELGKLNFKCLGYSPVKQTLLLSVFMKVRKQPEVARNDIAKTDDNEQDQLLEQPNLTTYQTLVRIKFTSTEEFLHENDRSKLIFCYTQKYDQLPAMYLLIASLLDSAGLLAKTPRKSEHEAQELEPFALALMLAAYFDSHLSRDTQSGSPGKLLYEFFNIYSSAWPINNKPEVCICVRPIGGATDCKLELVSLNKEELPTRHSNSGLVVLDPLSDQSSQEQTNLTPDQQTNDRVLGLFERVSKSIERLDKEEEKTADNSKPQKSITEQLFDSVTRERTSKHDSVEHPGNDFEERSKFGSLLSMARWRTASQMSLSVKSRRSPFTIRKLMVNLMYLALFLIIRQLILGRLVDVRDDLKEQAREDLVQLKRTVFNEAATLRDSSGLADGRSSEDHLNDEDQTHRERQSNEMKMAPDSVSDGRNKQNDGTSKQTSLSVDEPSPQEALLTDELLGRILYKALEDGDLDVDQLMALVAEQGGFDMEDLQRDFNELPAELEEPSTGSESSSQSENLARKQPSEL